YFGFASLNYEVTDWFSVFGRITYDGTQDFQEERIAIGSASVSRYSRFDRTASEANYDLMLNFTKDITEDISFKGLLGGSIRRNKLHSIRAATNGGLV